MTEHHLKHDFVFLQRTWKLHAYQVRNPGGSTSYAVEIIMPGGSWESARTYKSPEQALAAARAHIRRHGIKVWQGKLPKSLLPVEKAHANGR